MSEDVFVNETDVLCGEEDAAQAPDSEGRQGYVWTWTVIDPDNDLAVPGPSDSPERTVALRMLASIPNTGSRGVYRRDINYFMNWWQADYAPVLLSQSDGDPRTPVDATRADLEQYLIHLGSLEEPIAAATINRRIAVVASFYNRAVDDSDMPVESNPAARLKRPQIDNDHRTGLETGEAGKLLSTARKWPDRTEGTLVLVLLLLGLRISEAVTLTGEDVIRDGGFVKVSPKRKGKDGRTLLVVDEPDLAARLEQLSNRGPRLFPGIDRFAGGRIVAKIGKAAGLGQPLFPHLLRHTFVTELLRSGMDIESVRVLAGHSSIETTQRYAKAIAAEATPVAGRLSNRYERPGT